MHIAKSIPIGVHKMSDEYFSRDFKVLQLMFFN